MIILPQKVILTEVSPRDGLQNESTFVPTDIKIQFIELLTHAGFSIIETTSFVNSKKIPALADSDDVMRHFTSTQKTHYSALIPNTQGLQNAINAGCKHIAVITAISETFAQKNMHCSIAESVQRIADIIKTAKARRLTVRGYISCTMGCPYEGCLPIENTVTLAKQLWGLGCDEITIADTTGTGTPLFAQNVMRAVLAHLPVEKLAIHFHDTYGQALANIFACLELGIFKIDASVGGLGGCPYAKGASGNVATEDVLYMLNQCNIQTGVDLYKTIQASNFIHARLSHTTRSKVAQVLQAH